MYLLLFTLWILHLEILQKFQFGFHISISGAALYGAIHLWLRFVTRGLLQRPSRQEPASSDLPFLHRRREVPQLLFLTSQHRCQWLAGLTIDPSHHIKVSISAAEFIGGTSSWKSRAVHSSRRCPKEWQVLKPLQGGKQCPQPFLVPASKQRAASGSSPPFL